MMRRLTLLAAFLFSMTFAPRGGGAVSYDTLALGRISSFTVITEVIDRNSQICGIEKSSVYRAIEYPLVGTGLVTKLPKDKGDAILLDVSMVSIIVWWTMVCRESGAVVGFRCLFVAPLQARIPLR
jgi:hypothetical protein